MEPTIEKAEWKDDPTNPENRVCKCGHTQDRHVEGWNVKHCKGDDPKPFDADGNPWVAVMVPCLCSSYEHDRNR